MPATAQATALHVRMVTCSRKKNHPITATAAGMAAKVTPAEAALVRATPYSMHTVKRKLPRNDWRNSSRRVGQVSGGSSTGLGSQCSMATPPMPKRIQASRSTGKTVVRGLESAT